MLVPFIPFGHCVADTTSKGIVNMGNGEEGLKKGQEMVELGYICSFRSPFSFHQTFQ
jgi:hypothetical protein